MAGPASIQRESAPAKVNLTLRVLGRRGDGFHDLESLVVFADLEDEVSLAPQKEAHLDQSGTYASSTGDSGDNLILKAHRELAARLPGLRSGLFHLRKELPVAAGLGGGSSDAAAALRLLARLNGLHITDVRLREAAAAVGSDVPVCLERVSRVMSGRGDILGPPVRLPPLPAVLVNPHVAVPTPAVFKALGCEPGQAATGQGHAPSGAGYSAMVSYLRESANDLEPPAFEIAPVIKTVTDALAGTNPDLVRMSGSGGTVFALYPDEKAAAAAARRLLSERPDWWIKSTILR